MASTLNLTCSSATRANTLVDALITRRDSWVQAMLVISGAIATALAAQVAVPLPFTPVPLTGQTFAVLLCGVMLGARKGALSQLLYGCAGAFGLPVFAGAGAGTLALFGPTGGYILAFPLAALTVGWLAERGCDRRFSTTVAAMTLGTLMIHAMGLLWLSRFVPGATLLSSSFLPFLPGDVVKILLAAVALPAARRHVG